MAAIFDKADPSSPLAYDSSKTALVLLDFQGFIIKACGDSGAATIPKAKALRDWASKNGVLVLHSIVDVNGTPTETCKGATRIVKVVEDARKDAEEPVELGQDRGEKEFTVLKSPGVVSGLKSDDAIGLLVDYGIRSLVICGLSTSGAVLRTALPASDNGFVVSIIKDACADPRTAVHEMLMDSILPSRAHVASAEHFLAEWEKAQNS